MDDQQELYMIFNLFEKLEPAPHHKTALDAFQAMADNVTTHKEFEEGIFLQNVDDSCKLLVRALPFKVWEGGGTEDF